MILADVRANVKQETIQFNSMYIHISMKESNCTIYNIYKHTLFLHHIYTYDKHDNVKTIGSFEYVIIR